MSCIGSDHLSTIAGNDFNPLLDFFYKALVKKSLNIDVEDFEEGFQYSYYPSWCVLAKLTSGEYALVSSANTSPPGNHPTIVEQVAYPLTRQTGLKTLIGDLEIHEEFASVQAAQTLLQQNKLDELSEMERKIVFAKTYRKQILIGEDPVSAKISAALLLG